MTLVRTVQQRLIQSTLSTTLCSMTMTMSLQYDVIRWHRRHQLMYQSQTHHSHVCSTHASVTNSDLISAKRRWVVEPLSSAVTTITAGRWVLSITPLDYCPITQSISLYSATLCRCQIKQMPDKTDAKEILTASSLENWRRPPGRPPTT